MKTTVRSVKKAATKTATTAAAGFAIGNPLMAAFVAGVGLAIWWTLRSRRQSQI